MPARYFWCRAAVPVDERAEVTSDVCNLTWVVGLGGECLLVGAKGALATNSRDDDLLACVLGVTICARCIAQVLRYCVR